MKLHVRQCPVCHRFALRVDGEQEWCRNMRFGFLDEIKQKHEVLSNLPIVCSDCNREKLEELAQTAGVTH